MAISDLFRPKYRHSNAQVRIQALGEVGDEILLTMAREDRDPIVRKAAIERLEDPEILADIARSDSDPSTQQVARSRAGQMWLTALAQAGDDHLASSANTLEALIQLDDQTLLVEAARRLNDAQLRAKAVDSIRDGKYLAELARKKPALAPDLIARIEDDAILRSIAIDESRKAIGLTAVDQLRDERHLDAIATKASHKAVRARARKRLAELAKPEAPTRTPEEQRIYAERIQLCRKAEELASHHEWITTHDALRALELQWDALGRCHDAQLEARFRDPIQAYDTRRERYGAADIAAAARKAQALETAPAAPEAAPEAANDTELYPSQESSPSSSQVDDQVAPEPQTARAEADDAQTKTAEHQRKAQEATDKLNTFEAALASFEALELAAVNKLRFATQELKTIDSARTLIDKLDGSDRLRDLQARFQNARQRFMVRLGELREADDWEKWANLNKRQELLTKAKTLLASLGHDAIAEEPAATPPTEANVTTAAPDRAPARDEAVEATAAATDTTDSPATDTTDSPATDTTDSPAADTTDSASTEEASAASTNPTPQRSAPNITPDKIPTDLGEQLKTLQQAWKRVGNVPHSKGQELWDTFKAACDDIYEYVKVVRQSQQAVQNENLAKKQALCEQAEALATSTDWDKTAEEIKTLQTQWKSIGQVSRKKSDAVWKRFRTACDRFFEARKPHLQRSLAEQEENLAKKTALCEQAEALAGGDDTPEAAGTIKKLQRDWKEIGLVPRKDARAINQRFRSACDSFFQKHKDRIAAEREARKQAVLDVQGKLDELDDVIRGSDAEPQTVAETTLSLRTQIAGLECEDTTLVTQTQERLRKVAHAALEKFPAAFSGSELDIAAIAKRKEKLCERAESLLPAPADAPPAPDDDAEDIAAKLKNALSNNALKSTITGPNSAIANELAELKAAWLRAGPLPGQQGDELERRFTAICARAD